MYVRKAVWAEVALPIAESGIHKLLEEEASAMVANPFLSGLGGQGQQQGKGQHGGSSFDMPPEEDYTVVR